MWRMTSSFCSLVQLLTRRTSCGISFALRSEANKTLLNAKVNTMKRLLFGLGTLLVLTLVTPHAMAQQRRGNTGAGQGRGSNGSQNHLRAFAAQIAKQGGAYNGQFLTQAEFDRIASSTGQGRGQQSAQRGKNHSGQGLRNQGSGQQRGFQGQNSGGQGFGASSGNKQGGGGQGRGKQGRGR